MNYKKILNKNIEYDKEKEQKADDLLNILKEIDINKLVFTGLSKENNKKDLYYYFIYTDDGIHTTMNITYHITKQSKSICVMSNGVMILLSEFDIEYIDLYNKLEEQLKSVLSKNKNNLQNFTM